MIRPPHKSFRYMRDVAYRVSFFHKMMLISPATTM